MELIKVNREVRELVSDLMGKIVTKLVAEKILSLQKPELEGYSIISNALGISSSTLQGWMKGRTIPSIDRVEKIELYFDLPRSNIKHEIEYRLKKTDPRFLTSFRATGFQKSTTPIIQSPPKVVELSASGHAKEERASSGVARFNELERRVEHLKQLRKEKAVQLEFLPESPIVRQLPQLSIENMDIEELTRLADNVKSVLKRKKEERRIYYVPAEKMLELAASIQAKLQNELISINEVAEEFKKSLDTYVTTKDHLKQNFLGRKPKTEICPV
jgi:Helix-turn-helix.